MFYPQVNFTISPAFPIVGDSIQILLRVIPAGSVNHGVALQLDDGSVLMLSLNASGILVFPSTVNEARQYSFVAFGDGIGGYSGFIESVSVDVRPLRPHMTLSLPGAAVVPLQSLELTLALSGPDVDFLPKLVGSLVSRLFFSPSAPAPEHSSDFGSMVFERRVKLPSTARLPLSIPFRLAACDLSLGFHRMTSNFEPDASSANFASANASAVFEVMQQPVEIKLLTSSSVVDSDSELVLQVSVSTGANGTVALNDGIQQIAQRSVDSLAPLRFTIAGSSLSPGVHSLSANYSGDSRYLPSSASVAVTRCSAGSYVNSAGTACVNYRCTVGLSSRLDGRACTVRVSVRCSGGLCTLAIDGSGYQLTSLTVVQYSIVVFVQSMAADQANPFVICPGSSGFCASGSSVFDSTSLGAENSWMAVDSGAFSFGPANGSPWSGGIIKVVPTQN